MCLFQQHKILRPNMIYICTVTFIKVNVLLDWCSFIYDMLHIHATTTCILDQIVNCNITVGSHIYKTLWIGYTVAIKTKKWMEWFSVFLGDGCRPTDIWIRNYLLTFLRASLLAIIKLFMVFVNIGWRVFCFAFSLESLYLLIGTLLHFFVKGRILQASKQIQL